MTTKQTPQEKAAQAIKVDPDKTVFTVEEALQEGADRMSLRYGKATKEEIREQRRERAEAAAQAADERAAALSADADATGITRPNAGADTDAAAPAKKAAAAPAKKAASSSSDAPAQQD